MEVHRPLHKMPPRNRFLLTIAFFTLIFGIALVTFLRRDKEPAQVYPAAINRDCAPWDGAAFTVSIPLEEAVIRISIYRSPEFRQPTSFTFPDETRMTGSALLLLPVGMPENLSGRVSFQRVEQGMTVDGKFDLATDVGQEFKGEFTAEWENEAVYCG